MQGKFNFTMIRNYNSHTSLVYLTHPVIKRRAVHRHHHLVVGLQQQQQLEYEFV